MREARPAKGGGPAEPLALPLSCTAGRGAAAAMAGASQPAHPPPLALLPPSPTSCSPALLRPPFGHPPALLSTLRLPTAPSLPHPRPPRAARQLPSAPPHPTPPPLCRWSTTRRCCPACLPSWPTPTHWCRSARATRWTPSARAWSARTSCPSCPRCAPAPTLPWLWLPHGGCVGVGVGVGEERAVCVCVCVSHLCPHTFRRSPLTASVYLIAGRAWCYAPAAVLLVATGRCRGGTHSRVQQSLRARTSKCNPPPGSPHLSPSLTLPLQLTERLVGVLTHGAHTSNHDVQVGLHGVFCAHWRRAPDRVGAVAQSLA